MRDNTTLCDYRVVRCCAAALACMLVLLCAAGAGAQEVDMLIDGNGAGIYGALGSGAGGSSTRFATTPGIVEFTLEIRNLFNKKNKYSITWNQIPGWVITLNGSQSPYQTTNVDPGASIFATFQVSVPAGVLPGEFPFILDAVAVKFKDKPWESVGARVQVTTQLFGIVRGTVFDDRDHDGVFSAGDIGLSGVTVREDAAGTSALTGADGSFSFMIPAGVPARIYEQNPSGYLSLSPDTLGPFTANAGDTVNAAFADVPPLSLSSGMVLNGLAGGFVDFPHRVSAGTGGQATLTAAGGSGSVVMLFLDANSNGVFDTGDRILQTSDCYLDPVAGAVSIDILVRVFIPAGSVPGDMITVILDAVQEVERTSWSFNASANDVVVVVDAAAGMLSLNKEADTAAAAPGSLITYTIHFINAGTDTLQNVILFDPVSAFVDLMPGAFGPGRDVAWQMGAMPVRYLTIDAADGDECEYSAPERLLRIIFSKNDTILIPPGRQGTVSYKVMVQ